MSDTDRVARWRQRMRDEGKEPMTIWLSHDEKLRLEDLARTRRCTTSDMVAQALAQFRPGSPDVTATVPDTAQLRVLMQEALLETTAVTELVTDMVTATLARDLPALVREAIAGIGDTHTVSPVTDSNSNVAVTEPPETAREDAPAQESQADPSHSMRTEPTAPRKGGRPSPERQQILALLAEHPEGLTAEQIRVYITAEKSLRHTLHGMKRNGYRADAGTGAGATVLCHAVGRLPMRCT